VLADVTEVTVSVAGDVKFRTTSLEDRSTTYASGTALMFSNCNFSVGGSEVDMTYLQQKGAIIADQDL
jgi:hypothetical protein